MDMNTGRIQELPDWENEIGEEEMTKRIDSGRLVVGDFDSLKNMAKLNKLAKGSKNQRKKYRQLLKGKK